MAQVDAVELGNIAATGWRAKVADAAADPVANASPLKPEQVRALIGATFFVLSLVYVLRTVLGAAQQLRS